MADATTQVCYIERAAGATPVWNGLELDNCNKRIAGVFPVPAQYPRTAHFCPTQTEIDFGLTRLAGGGCTNTASFLARTPVRTFLP